MAFFKPTTMLDKFYEIGILIKGVDGLVELLAGVFLLTVPPSLIRTTTYDLTRGELVEDPHDFFASHLAHVGAHLAQGHNGFVAAFLLIHGVVKVGLVICLLLNKLWAYPLGLVVLGLLLLYQLYELATKPTIGIALLSALDVAIIWLIWREWGHVKASRGPHPAPPAEA